MNGNLPMIVQLLIALGAILAWVALNALVLVYFERKGAGFIQRSPRRIGPALTPTLIGESAIRGESAACHPRRPWRTRNPNCHLSVHQARSMTPG